MDAEVLIPIIVGYHGPFQSVEDDKPPQLDSSGRKSQEHGKNGAKQSTMETCFCLLSEQVVVDGQVMLNSKPLLYG